ncbi:MAG: hypothetical protein MUD14_12175 [Hydrococcus sp. Prado102]|nr:hypothetical protein [Hydrococcus sp. Prado102]
MGFTQTYKLIFPTNLLRFKYYYQFEEFFCEEHGKLKINVGKALKKQSITSTLRIRLRRSKLEIEENLKQEQIK